MADKWLQKQISSAESNVKMHKEVTKLVEHENGYRIETHKKPYADTRFTLHFKDEKSKILKPE
jgi:hypothetical protein